VRVAVFEVKVTITGGDELNSLCMNWPNIHPVKNIIFMIYSLREILLEVKVIDSYASLPYFAH